MQRKLILSGLILLSAIGLDSCSVLGVGKQCWTCKTQYTATANSGVPKDLNQKEICNEAERKQYEKDNQGSKNGLFLITTCTPN